MLTRGESCPGLPQLFRRRERFTPITRDAIHYEVTVEDPKVFTRPWKISMPLYRRLEPNAQLLEYRCMEFVEEFLWGNLRKQQLVKRWEGETIIVEARGAALAQTSSLVLTIRVGQQPAQQCRSRKIGLWICGFRYFDGPQRPVNAGQIGLFGYAFMPDEFRPCADRSVRRSATTIASQCSLSAVSTGVLLSPAL